MTVIPTVWLGVSILYLGTAAYLHLGYRNVLPISVPFSFFAFGAAIFTALNRSTFAATDTQLFILETLTLMFLVISWGAGVWAVRAWIHYATRHDLVIGRWG